MPDQREEIRVAVQDERRRCAEIARHMHCPCNELDCLKCAMQKSIAAAILETPSGQPTEYKHWLWCNADRRFPAGESGHGCCCFNGKAEYVLKRMAQEGWKSESASPSPEGPGETK